MTVPTGLAVEHVVRLMFADERGWDYREVIRSPRTTTLNMVLLTGQERSARFVLGSNQPCP